ncbi:MAG: MarR family transcriptional regulator [Treponema sp.]
MKENVSLDTKFQMAARLLLRKEMMQRRESGYYSRHFSGSPGQRRILALLRLKNPASQKELLDVCGIRPASLSELLNKMETAGYLTRIKDETDKRSVLVSLTDAGRKAADEWENDSADDSSGFFDSLTPEEKNTLSAILQKLIQDCTPEDNDPYCRRLHHHHGMFRDFPFDQEDDSSL